MKIIAGSLVNKKTCIFTREQKFSRCALNFGSKIFIIVLRTYLKWGQFDSSHENLFLSANNSYANFYFRHENISEIGFQARNLISGSKFEIWHQIWVLARNLIFGTKSDFWHEIWNLTPNVIFGTKSNFWHKI